MLVLRIAAPLKVPVLDGTDDMAFVCRAQLDLDFIARCALRIREQQVEPPLLAGGALRPGPSDRPRPRRDGSSLRTPWSQRSFNSLESLRLMGVARRRGVAEPTEYAGGESPRRRAGGPGEAAGGRSGVGQRDGTRRRRGNLLRPATRRRATSSLTDQSPVSRGGACQVTGPARATQRDGSRPSPDEPALIARSGALALRCGRSGSRRITALLRRGGLAREP